MLIHSEQISIAITGNKCKMLILFLSICFDWCPFQFQQLLQWVSHSNWISLISLMHSFLFILSILFKAWTREMMGFVNSGHKMMCKWWWWWRRWVVYWIKSRQNWNVSDVCLLLFLKLHSLLYWKITFICININL